MSDVSIEAADFSHEFSAAELTGIKEETDDDIVRALVYLGIYMYCNIMLD